MSRHSASRPGARATARPRPRSDRLVGLLSLLVLMVLLLGIPAALVVLRGNPLPGSGTDLGALVDRLTAPDDGSLFLAALTWIAWLGWASFAFSVLVEAAAQLRGLPAPRLPALGPQQRIAGVLVAAAALLVTAPLLSSPALAHPGGAPATTGNAASQALEPAVGPAAPARAPVAVAPRSAAAPSYTVQPGDSLWQIAHRTLGDGARFAEIAELNYGVPQADGRWLEAAHWLTPGWTLALPADATVPPTPDTDASDDSGTVVVQPGDTLWRIAQETLGDGARYEEIADASSAVQDDGRRLTDPDLIRPGWHLTIPPSVGALPYADDLAPITPDPRGQTAPPVEALPPAPADDVPAPGVDAPAGASALAGVEDPDGLDIDEPAAVRTAAGIGGLLAAGLLILVAARRARQQRRRRTGQRIAMPEADLAFAETELRAVEDPDGQVRIDHVLRTLSAVLGDAGRTLPALRLVRMAAGQIELYVAGDTDLPAPFAPSRDPAVWTLSGDAPLLSPADLGRVPAPYPSLVTLGHDLDGAHVLIDLEHPGSLGVVGDRRDGVAVLAALAAELATSSWSDDLQVTLVGCLPQLPEALGTGRVRHVRNLGQLLPALEHRAAAVHTALAAAGATDLRDARTSGAGRDRADGWTPEILLVADPVEPADRERLQALLHDLPDAGLAAITAGGEPLGEWTLTLDGGRPAAAVLDPVGLTLQPQQLDDTDLDQLLALLAVADRPAEEADGHRAMPAPPDLTSHEPYGLQVEVHHSDTAAAAVHLEPPPDVPEATELPPMLQLLGPVELLRPRGTVERSKVRQLTEISAFLALHPGRDHTHLSEAIWPGARAVDNTRNTAVSKLRKWLGTSPDGEDYVPRVLQDGYRLHPLVRTDWDLWLELLPDGPTAASTSVLATALELVKGKPFAGTNPRRYAWAERDRQDMISAIVDVAHELAGRALLDGNAPLARRAAAAGLQADPGAELLWRQALRAEWLAGDLTGLTTTADRLSALADELGDDLEPETVDLLDELLSRPRRKAGTP